MSDVDLDAIEAAASACTFSSVFAMAEIVRTDVPALIAAVRERDAAIARVRAVVDDWIDGRYGDDGYRVAPQPDDGHVLDHLRAALDPQEGQ
jgi:hypothetical protein